MGLAEFIDFALTALGLSTLFAGALTLGVGIAWLAFKAFAKGWLEHQFAQALADHQHGLDRRLEHARAQLSALLDRATRLHTKEFEVLPETWRLLAASWGSAARLLSPMQQYPSVERAEAAELEQSLKIYPFTETECESVRSAILPDRQAVFSALVDRHRYIEAAEDQRLLHNYIIINGIFVEPALRERLKALSLAVSDALLAYKIYNLEHFGRPDWKRLSEANKELMAFSAERDAIQQTIGDRLWQPIADVPA